MQKHKVPPKLEPPVSALVSMRMARTRGRDTKPELALRKAIRSLGLTGYRVSYAPIPQSKRTVDIAFTRSKVAVMLDGCFWHRCPEHYRPSTQRSSFWASKIAGNVARDMETNRALEEIGWQVVRVWEHEDSYIAAQKVVQLVKARYPASRITPSQATGG